MSPIVQITYCEIEEQPQYEALIEKVVRQCFEQENLQHTKFYIDIILTNPEEIRKRNFQYRKIDRKTDVLSFPMFEKEELSQLLCYPEYPVEEILGDIIISIDQVKEQAKQYGHCFERELAYMVVHGFYHIMGYDHIEEQDKKEMRQKEETVLQALDIIRDE